MSSIQPALRGLLDEDGRLTARVPCLSCEAPLTGAWPTPAHACPKCAAPTAPSLAKVIAAAQGWLDDDGRLTVDHACAACGYNLRTRRIGERCPECNTLIAPDFAHLGFALVDLRWANRARIAATCMTVSLMLTWLMGPIAVRLTATSIWIGPPRPMSTFEALFPAAGFTILIVLAFLPLIAMIMVAWPEPRRGDGGTTPNTAARLARVAGLVAMTACIVAVLAALAGAQGRWWVALPVIGWVAVTIAVAAFIDFVGALAERIRGDGSRRGWHVASLVSLAIGFTAPIVAFWTGNAAALALLFFNYVLLLAAAAVSAEVLIKYVGQCAKRSQPPDDLPRPE